MSTVGEMSQALEGALEAAGRMDQDDAKQWLVDNYSGEDEEVQSKDIGLVLGYGINPNRKWWHKEGPAPPKDTSVPEDLPDGQTGKRRVGDAA